MNIINSKCILKKRYMSSTYYLTNAET
uniref:Uncharacterized protein n=1 Tax=Lepeophtheirus salmonis TaxID=72036 RepID=A0A0K2UBR9_LEPSM